MTARSHWNCETSLFLTSGKSWTTRTRQRLTPPGRSIRPCRSGRALAKIPFARRIKRTIQRQIKRDPFPEFKDPQSYAWRLMAAIIQRFAHETKGKPCVIVPLFSVDYVLSGIRRAYWDRFASIADGRGRRTCVDVFPYFATLGEQAAKCFMLPHDAHLSDFGHAVLADALEAELRRLDLLPHPDRRP